MAPFGWPDWTALSSDIIPPPPMPISCPDVPIPQSVYVVKTSLKLGDTRLPFKLADRKRWTLKQQSLAAEALIPENLDEFSDMVCIFCFIL